MSDTPPPPAAGAPRRGIGALPRRTLAICVTVAAIAAVLAGLAAALVLDRSEPDAPTEAVGTLQPLASTVDTDALLAVPLKTVDDKPTTLAALLDGRPVVLNLWAQSCVPCVEEMPLLEQAHQANPDVAFLGVDTQDRPAKARELAAQTGITYPWVQDLDGAFFHEVKAAGLPMTYLLDRHGEVLATKIGAFDTLAELQLWIDEHRPQP